MLGSPSALYLPDLGLPQSQLLFVSKVKGHILRVICQSLGMVAKPHTRIREGKWQDAITPCCGEEFHGLTALWIKTCFLLPVL